MKYKLRKWDNKDAAALTKHANNEKVAMFLRNTFPHPYTLDDAKFYINDCIKNNNNKRIINLAITNEEDEAIGGIGVFMQDEKEVYSKCAEIGYWLSEEYWGEGIISAATADICKLAFENTDIVRISAEIFEPNKASAKVLEKNGFKLEGRLKDSVYKNGKILDSLLYALTRDEYTKKEAN